MSQAGFQHGYIDHTFGVDNGRAYVQHRMAHPTPARTTVQIVRGASSTSSGPAAQVSIDMNTVDFRADLERGAVIPASVYSIPPCPGGGCQCDTIRPTIWFVYHERKIRQLVGFSIAEIIKRHSQGKGPGLSPSVTDFSSLCELEYNVRSPFVFSALKMKLTVTRVS